MAVYRGAEKKKISLNDRIGTLGKEGGFPRRRSGSTWTGKRPSERAISKDKHVRDVDTRKKIASSLKLGGEIKLLENN